MLCFVAFIDFCLMTLAHSELKGGLRVSVTFLILVVIWFAESLETIARFTCGSVQSVNAYGCRSLRPTGFSSILDTAVSLRELRCGGCDRLERLEIPQMSLVCLEAQGCSSLRRYVQYSSEYLVTVCTVQVCPFDWEWCIVVCTPFSTPVRFS